jgi:hypothetical protein
MLIISCGVWFPDVGKKCMRAKMTHKAALELENCSGGSFKPGQNGVDSNHFAGKTRAHPAASEVE